MKSLNESPSVKAMRAAGTLEGSANKQLFRQLNYEDAGEGTNRKAKDTQDMQDMKHHTF